VPAADVVLAAIASRTNRLHLGSAVTVLSSDDPDRELLADAPVARRADPVATRTVA
jgi:hypothetical protein